MLDVKVQEHNQTRAVDDAKGANQQDNVDKKKFDTTDPGLDINCWGSFSL